jgi:APA family basic amino acid/polyamine antiporter
LTNVNARLNPAALVRAIGLPSLTAIALNGMIGGGIFGLPATVAGIVGRASPAAYLVAGVAVLLIALCFAEAGSLFERSGGPYLYARSAFGPFIGFEVGWMFVLARLTATGAVTNTFCAYVGYLWPALAQGVGRLAVMTLLIGALASINWLGLRPGIWAINVLTIGKLLPLLFFCIAGLFFLDSRGFSLTTIPPAASLQQASFVLLFAFGGFEFASVPTEEVIHPRRSLPLALIISVLIVVALYSLIQIVALGTLPNLAGDPAPLASAARNFLGPWGGLLMIVGAVLSTTGTSSASILVGSRMLYAMAQEGHLPATMARIHPHYRTPGVSILLFALGAWAIAISGSFAQLAGLSALARLIFYTTTCMAIPVLRRKIPSSERRFTLPGQMLIPLLAVMVCGWLLIGSSAAQALIALVALLAGAVAYWVFQARGKASDLQKD